MIDWRMRLEHKAFVERTNELLYAKAVEDSVNQNEVTKPVTNSPVSVPILPGVEQGKSMFYGFDKLGDKI